ASPGAVDRFPAPGPRAAKVLWGRADCIRSPAVRGRRGFVLSRLRKVAVERDDGAAVDPAEVRRKRRELAQAGVEEPRRAPQRAALDVVVGRGDLNQS